MEKSPAPVESATTSTSVSPMATMQRILPVNQMPETVEVLDDQLMASPSRRKISANAQWGFLEWEANSSLCQAKSWMNKLTCSRTRPALM